MVESERVGIKIKTGERVSKFPGGTDVGEGGGEEPPKRHYLTRFIVLTCWNPPLLILQ